MFRFLIVYLSCIGICFAECMGLASKPVIMEVKSCYLSEPDVKSLIADKNYSDFEISKIETSAKFVSIVEAKPVATVDIISWWSANSFTRYRGDETSIQDGEFRKYMALGVDQKYCEKYFAARIELFNVTDNFHCCADVNPDDDVFKTVAQCQLKLPVIRLSSFQPEDLVHIGIQRPDVRGLDNNRQK